MVLNLDIIQIIYVVFHVIKHLYYGMLVIEHTLIHCIYNLYILSFGHSSEANDIDCFNADDFLSCGYDR